jgi:3-isopropylmalate/(R)-2-methylmalate dehydratase small subunit
MDDVSRGDPLARANCADVTRSVETGDEVEVDFESGSVRNLTRGVTLQFKPLDAQLRSIIALGGWRNHLERRIATMGLAE